MTTGTNTPTLIIIRGLPGSGKSTLAAQICRGQEIFHFEADMFFEEEYSGTYNFNPKLLGVAHDWCYSNAVKMLKDGFSVVVSNTFTKKWELERYMSIGTLIPNVKIIVYEMKTQYENIHNVPEEKLKQMAARWEEIPEDWKKQLEDYIVVLE